MFQKLMVVSLLFLISCAHTINKNSDGHKCGCKKNKVGKNGGKINIDVSVFNLKNGLKLIVHENHKLPIFSYYTFYNVGGRNEINDRIGASHFLEHMMFKGTKKFGPGSFDKLIENSGGMNNAYTSRDMTVYHERMPKSELKKIIEIESDRMVNLELNRKQFDNEIHVVLDERLRNYDTNPGSQLFLTMMKEVFKGTPYGRSVLGSSKDIKGLTKKKISEYYKLYYAPNNATIIISGDVDAHEVYSEVKKKYGLIPKSNSIKNAKTASIAPSKFAFKRKLTGEIRLNGVNAVPLFIIALKGEPIGSRRGFVMDILSSILGDGESSYLFQRYVKGKRPMLASIGAGNYTLMKNGVFYIQGKFLRGGKKTLKIFKKKIAKDFRQICNKAISRRSVQKTKNQFLMGYYSSIRSNSGIAEFLGSREIYFNDFSYYKRELEIYESVTDHEVKGVCESVFKNGEFLMLSIWKGYPKTNNIL